MSSNFSALRRIFFREKPSVYDSSCFRFVVIFPSLIVLLYLLRTPQMRLYTRKLCDCPLGMQASLIATSCLVFNSVLCFVSCLGPVLATQHSLQHAFFAFGFFCTVFRECSVVIIFSNCMFGTRVLVYRRRRINRHI